MRTEHGFTIIEVMVAMVILSLALLELGKLQVTALRTTVSAGRSSEATAIAEATAERLMSLPYAPATRVTPAITAPELVNRPLSNPHVHPAPPPGYTVRWSVVQVIPAPGEADPNTKLVHVEVRQQNSATGKPFVLSLRKTQKLLS